MAMFAVCYSDSHSPPSLCPGPGCCRFHPGLGRASLTAGRTGARFIIFIRRDLEPGASCEGITGVT